MFQILTLNKIAAVGLNQLDQKRFAAADNFDNPDGILVRSAKMHDYEFPPALRAIARAGAGTNNIPIERCSEAGIVVFNTPGANANAVKEEVIFALLASSRRMFEANQWARQEAAAGADILTTMEKAKSQFAGPEIWGKTLGIVGLGAIGAKVADAALSLGMNIVGYDPYLSVPTALALDRRVQVVQKLEDLLKVADYVTLHVPLNDATRNMIDTNAITKMKDGVRLINLARNGLVDEAALAAAMKVGRVAGYVGSQTVCGETDMMNVAVTADFRRRGIGEQLVLALVEQLKALDSHSLTLEVRASNAPARALYEQLGFQEIGCRKNYYRSPREDGLILRKEWEI